ncbi:MAG: P-loop NTPase fold protein [Chlamydiota bacterium]
MNIQNKSHPFSADRPIKTRAEDELGRYEFAHSLAEAIRLWKGEDSLVIGLFGQWGQGKTSVKNMILEHLHDHKEFAPYIIEFNPWQWSGQSQIASAFFDEISTTLGRNNSEKNAAERAAKWRQWAILLNICQQTTGSLKRVIPYILWFLAITCGVTGFINYPIVRYISRGLASIFALLGGILQCSSGLAEAVAKYLEEKCRWGAKKLEVVHDELWTLMNEQSKPVLVVLDDIDRLLPDEIRLVFQLVKSNADFPNMIYLLLFQRDYVENVMEQAMGGKEIIRGRDFLEKIINVGFDLPLIEHVKIIQFLSRQINKVFQNIDITEEETHRMGNIFIGELRCYFINLRDVKRFLGSLEFHLNLLRPQGILEVNSTDLIAIETLRVFEPGVYSALPGIKSYLTASREGINESGKSEAKAAIDSVLAKSSKGKQEQVRLILKALFPRIQSIYGNIVFGNDWEDDWYRDRRICHQDIFNRYFLFRVASGDVSQADIERIMNNSGNRDVLVAEFRSFKKQEIFTVLLDRLEAYKQKISLNYAVPFITALYDVGDELPDEIGTSVLLSPELHAIRIVYWCLKQEPDEKKRGKLLVEATKQTTGIFLPTFDAHSEDRKRAKQDRDEFLVDEESSEILKTLCVEKIRQAAGDGSLATNRRLHYLLSKWGEWGRADEPCEWLGKRLETRQGLLAVLLAFVHRSASRTEGAYIDKIHCKFDLKSLEEFVSADTVTAAIGHLKGQDLTDEQREAIGCFKKAKARKQAGKPYALDQIWHDDKED